MKFINENWNAFYSFLITRIVAHNWAGCIRLEITSHLCMGHPPCVYICIFIALLHGVRARVHSERKADIQREGDETECWEKKLISSEEHWGRGQNERQTEIWSNGLYKSIFHQYYTALCCSCREQHLLTVSHTSVWWDLLSHIFATNATHTS